MHALSCYGTPRWKQNVNRSHVEKVRQEEKDLNISSKVSAPTATSVHHLTSLSYCAYREPTRSSVMSQSPTLPGKTTCSTVGLYALRQLQYFTIKSSMHSLYIHAPLFRSTPEYGDGLEGGRTKSIEYILPSRESWLATSACVSQCTREIKCCLLYAWPQ